MNALFIVVHVIVCLILIFAVLLQSGKAADLAGAFGGGGSQTAFGGRGSATLLSKLTTISAIIFMITSLGLWILSAQGTRSVVGGEKAQPAAAQTTQAPPAKKEAAEKKAPAEQPGTKTDQRKPPAQAGAEKR